MNAPPSRSTFLFASLLLASLPHGACQPAGPVPSHASAAPGAPPGPLWFTATNTQRAHSVRTSGMVRGWVFVTNASDEVSEQSTVDCRVGAFRFHWAPGRIGPGERRRLTMETDHGNFLGIGTHLMECQMAGSLGVSSGTHAFHFPGKPIIPTFAEAEPARIYDCETEGPPIAHRDTCAWLQIRLQSYVDESLAEQRVRGECHAGEIGRRFERQVSEFLPNTSGLRIDLGRLPPGETRLSCALHTDVHQLGTSRASEPFETSHDFVVFATPPRVDLAITIDGVVWANNANAPQGSTPRQPINELRLSYRIANRSPVNAGRMRVHCQLAGDEAEYILGEPRDGYPPQGLLPGEVRRGAIRFPVQGEPPHDANAHCEVESLELPERILQDNRVEERVSIW